MSTRALAVVAVAGQLLFVLAWVVAGLAQPGYSVADQTVSELFSRTAAHPWIVRAGIALLVPSYLASAALLHRRLGRGGLPATALFLLAVPLALIVDANPLDCMTNGSAACAAKVAVGDVSAAHDLHNTAAVTLQLCLVATPFAVAFALRASRRASVLLAIAVVGVATVAWVGLSGPGHSGYGIAQRTTFGFVNVWVTLIAIAAARGAGRDAARNTVAP